MSPKYNNKRGNHWLQKEEIKEIHAKISEISNLIFGNTTSINDNDIIALAGLESIISWCQGK